MKVVFTRQAEDGLEQIGDYIAQDNPRRAMTFMAELRASALALAETPAGYPLLPRYERLGVRRRVHGAYLILYRVVGGTVFVLHIIQGARDFGRLILPEE